MTDDPLRFRDALAADAETIAALHAASWRMHYRSALSEAYLNGPIEAERQTLWSARFRSPPRGQTIVVAEAGRRLLGFVCAFADYDPVWGTLIDNLHVAVDRKRGGLGRTLMREVAGRLAQARPERPIYLFVLCDNVHAQAFYNRLGGEPAGSGLHPLPDGSNADVIRYAWASPRRLMEPPAREGGEG